MAVNILEVKDLKIGFEQDKKRHCDCQWRVITT